MKQDLLKVGVQQVRDIGGLGGAVVLFWCVSPACPFISGDVIPSSRSAPMLLTLHLRFDVLASASVSAVTALSTKNAECPVPGSVCVSRGVIVRIFLFNSGTFSPAHLTRSLIHAKSQGWWQTELSHLQARTCTLVLFSHKTECFEVLKRQEDRVAVMCVHVQTEDGLLSSVTRDDTVSVHTAPEMCWNLTLPCQSQLT